MIDAYIDGVELYLDEIFCENNLMPEKIKGAERDSIVDRIGDHAIQYAKNELKVDDLPGPREYYLGFDNSYKPNEIDNKAKSKVNEYKNLLRIGDSSGKVELTDLRNHGYNVRGVKKGPGSQYRGIKLLRGYSINVTKRSTNLIEGFKKWSWKVDPNGKIIPEPEGHEPDGLAAARYIVMGKALW